MVPTAAAAAMGAAAVMAEAAAEVAIRAPRQL
jgi:hypothetical protein